MQKQYGIERAFLGPSTVEPSENLRRNFHLRDIFKFILKP